MIEGVSGAILAGGRSSRFHSDKPKAPWGDSTLVETISDILSGLFRDQSIVVKTPEALGWLARPGRRVVTDGLAEHHALGGLRAALLAAPSERVFVCACDMPFLEPALITALCRESAGFDAAVAIWEERLQPLCAVYSKSCLPEIELLLSEERLRIRDLFPRVRTRVFSEAEVNEIAPEGRSFLDLDTPGDYAAALREMPAVGGSRG